MEPDQPLNRTELDVSLLQSLLEFAPDAILAIDRHGTILVVNSQVERYFGYSREELLGQKIELLVPDRFKHAHPGYRDGYFAHPQIRPMGSGLEPNGRRKDGSEFPIDASLSPVETTDGLIAMAIVRDISRRRSNEAELARRAAALEAANRELKQMDQHKDEFLAILSHELRTPLNAIMGFASIMDDEVQGALNDRQHESLQRILDGTDRMLFLVDNLLSMSRIQAGRMEHVRASHAFAPLVHTAIEALASRAEKKHVAFETAISFEGEVRLDPSSIKQVLVNLLDNAVKFSPPGGTVAITVSVRGSELLTEITDQGPGVPTEALERIFERFSQLDMTATREAGGVGLGLTVSKALVEMHGGRIGLTSAPGRGATAWFSLPLGDTHP